MLSVNGTGCGTPHAHSDRSPMRTPRPLHDIPRVVEANDRISPRLLANFALLRTRPDDIPLTARQALAGPAPGLRWNLARRIPVSLPRKYWLVPGIGNICVVTMAPRSSAAGAVCASVTQALHHGVASTTLNPASGRRSIVGVVPDGINTVIVRSGTKISSTTATHGRFVLHDSVAAPPDELTLR
jgi:hypothetical protein